MGSEMCIRDSTIGNIRLEYICLGLFGASGRGPGRRGAVVGSSAMDAFQIADFDAVVRRSRIGDILLVAM